MKTIYLIIGALIGFTPLISHANQPNILWLVAEDMSPDLSCYGNEAVSTPNIDWMAANGMKFNRVFTTGPACSPSRTALITGVYQTTVGAYHMRYSDELKPDLPKHIKMLPELMRENGYRTGNIKGIGETGTGKDDFLFKTPKKVWDTQSWDELTQSQPFFGQINFSDSHRPFGRIAKVSVSEDEVQIPPYYPDHPVSRKDWAGYLEEVNVADQHVGDILARLKQDGLADNTIVIFISDHGRPMIRAKNWLYDGGTMIPMVIYIPKSVDAPAGFLVGGENSDLLSGVDLVAETLLLAGGKIPDWMQGRSFLRKNSKPRQYLYTAADRFGNIDSQIRAVRTDRYKYIRNFKTPGSVNECTTAYRRSTHPIYHLLNIMGEKRLLTPAQEQLLKPLAGEELYDLENDPYEVVNLAGNSDYEAIRKGLATKLAEWIEDSKDKGFHKDSEANVKHFYEYGITTFKKQKESIEKRRASVEMWFKN